jgi:hypothetical protein
MTTLCTPGPPALIPQTAQALAQTWPRHPDMAQTWPRRARHWPRRWPRPRHGRPRHGPDDAQTTPRRARHGQDGLYMKSYPHLIRILSAMSYPHRIYDVYVVCMRICSFVTPYGPRHDPHMTQTSPDMAQTWPRRPRHGPDMAQTAQTLAQTVWGMSAGGPHTIAAAIRKAHHKAGTHNGPWNLLVSAGRRYALNDEPLDVTIPTWALPFRPAHCTPDLVLITGWDPSMPPPSPSRSVSFTIVDVAYGRGDTSTNLFKRKQNIYPNLVLLLRQQGWTAHGTSFGTSVFDPLPGPPTNAPPSTAAAPAHFCSWSALLAGSNDPTTPPPSRALASSLSASQAKSTPARSTSSRASASPVKQTHLS